MSADIQNLFVAFDGFLVYRFLVGTVAPMNHIDVIAFGDKMMLHLELAEPLEIRGRNLIARPATMNHALGASKIGVMIERAFIDNIAIMVSGKVYYAGKRTKKSDGFFGEWAKINVIAKKINRLSGKARCLEITEKRFKSG